MGSRDGARDRQRGDALRFVLRGAIRLIWNVLLISGYVGHEVKRLSPRPLPAPDINAAQVAGPVDRTLLEWFHRNTRGVLNVQAKARRDNVVAQVAAAWQDVRVAFVCVSKDECDDVARRLRRMVDDVGVVHAGDNSEIHRRIVVGTPNGFKKTLSKFDFVFCNSVTEAQEGRYAEAIKFASKTRVYGFMRAGAHLTKWERGKLHETFGFKFTDVVRPEMAKD